MRLNSCYHTLMTNIFNILLACQYTQSLCNDNECQEGDRANVWTTKSLCDGK